ncbi:MiaB/RimO family radical SAM methylthiotransferase [Patescibacteria group bacterium]|nr:MiaB/RimO family radical SAM methylthiotransferase [Patescibacteria group bacterium]
MNYSDAERVQTVLNDLGYKQTQQESQADLIVVLACSVRQKAVDRIHGRANRWNKVKKKRSLITLLTGCLLKTDRKLFDKSFDHIFPITELKLLPQLLNKNRTKNNKALSSDLDNYFDIKPQYNSKFQAFIPISRGCNKHCSYCAVPLTRGKEVSRPPNDIIKEVRQLIKNGYKEITLVGQNVNSYGWDFQGVAINFPQRKVYYHDKDKRVTASKLTVKNPMNFPQLLNKIENIPGKFWIRFITSHPYDMSDELINVIAQSKKITSHINLPVQSGSDKILQSMNRQYAVKHFKDLITKIRKHIPNAVISTDFIVGFCGETRKDFKDSCQLVKELKFDMAFISQYSTRPGTPAANLKDNVSIKEKRLRDQKLTEILSQGSQENNNKLINTEQTVLFEKCSKGYCDGKTYGLKNIRVKSDKDITGLFATVKVTSATAWSLKGALKKRSSPSKQ